ncbi:cytochrome c oxidase accessory protein CcoG [Kiloniella laminariae]|uniref:Cytochrome c oxidase accessory protein CcoG n=1 Tax=Kiloniella laminariae TaxID=454162 RepID=A0ABT4LG85_9PROT|nr:cytochrome c oxidase accessory protein CcoG [Kiloniella laminariae]MCZ4280112.1 cytochrome c oxidase accessory protein CcoG [Kiloniella laminariae]
MSTKLEDIVRDATIEVDAVNKKENRSLYKKREPIFPKRATGQFRRLKWLIMILTLSIYYLVPFIRWDRGPGAPDQAVLIDFPGNRFYFFFIELWPQEVYYITGILIVAALLLFFFTSLFGRVWCGYSCPQTVWTDLFIAVERWVEGDRNARIKLHRAPWSLEKIGKYSLKHTIWLLIGVATGGAWVFYFADAPTLFVELFTLQADMMAYSFVALLTFTTYTLGGLAREQVCIYMCPWPRIQGAMMDEDSLQVTYKLDRGEPRGRAKKAHDDENFGDCIDCKQCVVVCPMGIDIRDGSQLECINCALCIDACDGIMDKMGTPRGLIAYDTDANLARRIAGKAEQFTLLRMRTVLYALAIVFVCAVMGYVLMTRSSLDLNVLRDRNPIFVKLSDGSIRNGYTVKILNKERSVRQFAVSVDGLPVETLKINDIADTSTAPIVEVKPDSLRSVHLFISVNETNLASASEPVNITVTDTENGNSVTYDSVFIGPEKRP